MSEEEASAALSEIRSTVLVIGSRSEQGTHFMLANWGTQSSFDPWRYVVAIKRTSRTLTNIETARAFTVNLFDPPHADAVRQVMAHEAEGKEAATPAPRHPEAYAGFECKVIEILDIGGDHVLVVGEVEDGWKGDGGPAVLVDELDLSYAG